MDFDKRANTILLSRRRKVLFGGGDSELPLEYVATFLRNVQTLGFTFSGPALDRLCTLSEQDFLSFYGFVVEQLRKMVGDQVAWEPMYPNFPEQVMAMDEVELYLNAIVHYLGDWLGVRFMPYYDKEARPPLADELDLEVIGLGTENELWEIGRQLMGSKTSISAKDKGDIYWFIAQNRDSIERVLPTDIPHKENLAVVAQAMMTLTDRADLVLTPYFKTATDVLRLATAMSDGDVSLAANTKFVSFKRAERRLLLALLDRIAAPMEDMQRNPERWKRLGERLHPGEYRDRYAKAAEAFDRIRNDLLVKTFNRKVEDALREARRTKDTSAVLTLLKQRPGELARRLDHLLRLSAGPDIVAAFRDAAPAVSTPVLLQVAAHFAGRQEPAAVRTFFPKGNVARAAVIQNELAPIPAPVCEAIVDACEAALIGRFSELEPLGKVFVDAELHNFVVPFSQRSASESLRTLVRGSKLPMPAGSTIRFFLWWKEGEVDGTSTGRVDVDLSAAMYDADWTYLQHISYTNLKSEKFKAAHSGDITSAPNGACEFIDLDIESFANNGGRYVVMAVKSYTGQLFTTMPECFAGWMARQEPNSGEIFEPSTVVDRLDIAADTQFSIPVILDMVERTVYWADLALNNHPAYANNIESNQTGMAHMGAGITTLQKPTLGHLFGLHAQARGELVESREEADVVFDRDDAFAVEAVMADYL